MDLFTNTFYLLPPLFASVVSLILAVLVWRGAHKSFGKWIFLGLVLSVGLWSLLTFGMRSSPDVQRALPWERALVVANFAVFVFYYHFTLVYSNLRRKRGILTAIYLLLVTSAVLAPTDLLIKEMRLEYYGYAPIPGPASFPFVITSFVLMAWGVRNLLKRYKASSSYEEKNRILYFVIAVAFPLLGAFLDAFSNLPPAAIWGNLIFCVMCSIAILKYHLLDIRVVIRKSLVYLLISAIVAIPYVSVLLLINLVLTARIETWWTHAIIVLLLAIALRPLFSWAQNLVDRLFYRDRYDYLRSLQGFINQAQSITNLEQLGSTMVQLIIGALRASSACLLLPSEGDNGLVIVSSTGLEKPPHGIVLRKQSLLIKWLKLHQDILTSEDLDIVPQLQSLSTREKKKLEQMSARLYVPIKSREEELPGLLVLGQKLSLQSYSNEDKRLLTTLSSQMAMTLENARLYGDALRARENLETWLNSMPDCVMIVNTDYTTQFMNKAAIDEFGSKTGGKCWYALGKDTACLSCPVQHYLHGNRDGLNYSERIGDREYDIATAPLLNPDGSLSIIEVLRDITERKREEAERKEMEQKTQLASRLASVGEMASGIAHEINNPLTGVIGFAGRLMKKDIPDDIRKYVETIYDGSQRVASIVSRLLTFARQYKQEFAPANVNEIIETTLELRAYALETSNIKNVTQFEPKMPPIRAVAMQLQQVFLNIIINAETEMKLAHGRGSLFIKTEIVDNTIRIYFKDDGPGISKENLEKIFQPFFTTRKVGQGTGLGLSVCHGIVAEHNGKIYAQSKLGKGATFVVELPIVTRGKPTQLIESAADQNREIVEAKILAVDDEPVILQLLDEELTEEGYEVETVDNADDALERIKNEKYGIILLDIKLPGMGGIELYNQIKSIARPLARRVIFITGDVMGADTEGFLSKAGAPYIAKPFDIEQLKRVINATLTQGT